MTFVVVGFCMLFWGLHSTIRVYINPLISFVISLVVSALAVFYSIHSILNYYLNRRIKLIYKMIRKSKVSMSNTSDWKDTDDDVLSRVELEVGKWISEQQKEIQSLKDLENYRKNFLGNISHELKTPIFAVQGYVHTLLDGGLTDPNVNRRFLKKAAKNIDRLETIVEDLDIIAKLEAATLQLDTQEFDIKELAVEVIEEVEVQAMDRNISIQLKQGADQSFMVVADKEYIRTVLLNLIVNSIKYGKQDGFTKIGFYNMDSYILVEVADNGIGIEQKHLKHLFDRFYRVDKSRSRERGGSGLGLSIVKHIIEAHQQTINVRSTPGLGTTLGFTIEKSKSASDDRLRIGRKMTVS